MAQDPRDIFRKLQRGLNDAQQKGSRGLPGGPRNFFGGAAGLVLLGTGVVVVNNALFNGTVVSADADFHIEADWSQWMVVIEPSSTRG